jgi:hypothetical protein
MEALLNKNSILDFEPAQSSVYLEQEAGDNSNDMWASINIFHFPKFWENSLLIETDNILHKISILAVKQIIKVRSFATLQQNWDSYDAAVPSDVAINNASDFIYQMDSHGQQPYFVAPGKNGEVLVEYKNENRVAEIYFNPDGTNELLLFANNDVITESNIEESMDQLVAYIK